MAKRLSGVEALAKQAIQESFSWGHMGEPATYTSYRDWVNEYVSPIHRQLVLEEIAKRIERRMETRRGRNLRYYHKNKEKLNESLKKYKRSHPEKNRVWQRNYRMRKKGLLPPWEGKVGYKKIYSFLSYVKNKSNTSGV